MAKVLRNDVKFDTKKKAERDKRILI